ncbi:carbohydrate ABC transporter permease [Aureimonas jatrophae]|uniref:Carbohydrate ABC transporter membrane protein 2, CUT1 family n=1 Tax=Aureimonas jatrophae TaxID=1166073 RepID=A0A1H0D0M7_9HYPH|nr:carbohydrate ABC transporter permease [Aureimonas jatrophae]MBB3949442.1 glucose/mannose transport system permease protein [Aureimonas jatrophae]SDN63714.1 carbohydrate ABC transporter membrane protein 2, CUT1 family [Aureimonas jatrophae]
MSVVTSSPALPVAGRAFPATARGPKPRHLTAGRVGLYAFLAIAALFFLLPLYIMLMTSLKTMDEIRVSSIFAWPADLTFEAWRAAWSTACTGLACNGIQTGFLNSMQILVPSVLISIAVGSVTGYALSLWRPKGANLLFAVLLLGAFIPYQVFIYPLVRMFSTVGLYGSLPGIVLIHTTFGLPVMTLLFRNYYGSLPSELFKAARVDGAGFWQIFFRVLLPMSTPILVVAAILQVTGIWNDFILGLVFAGRENLPMTVQLNNIVNSTQGERLYNVNMAATILTALVPLVVYFVSGRWFVRGIAAGSVKG